MFACSELKDRSSPAVSDVSQNSMVSSVATAELVLPPLNQSINLPSSLINHYDPSLISHVAHWPAEQIELRVSTCNSLYCVQVYDVRDLQSTLRGKNKVCFIFHYCLPMNANSFAISFIREGFMEFVVEVVSSIRNMGNSKLSLQRHNMIRFIQFTCILIARQIGSSVI